ncbi:MAG: aconitate hydratase AcnA [Deltaproteobacteria bacterium]|nr:aconitate hydratase AcnA [Deltaproteobacteria bacterium]
MDNTFGCLDEIKLTSSGKAQIYRLENLEKSGVGNIQNLPYSIKILLEQVLRNLDGFMVKQEDVVALAKWNPREISDNEIPFKPSRVVLQDFTGVPSLVDLAALRSAMVEMKGDPAMINPQVPVDLIIDHSVQVDDFGSPDSLEKNMRREFERNLERYEFIKWGQSAFKNLRVFPPGLGIVHQINLENLAEVVHLRDGLCFPDTVVGTDSHTTMINGVGVLGWGVGGIEAESVMLNQPIYMKIPEVVGFELKGEMNPGMTATDLVLRIVEILRSVGVVDKFVEFYGQGLSSLKLADRATIANMAPEYGATMGFFPVDNETLSYLAKTGRPQELIKRTEVYLKEQGLFRTEQTEDPLFTQKISLDLSEIVPSLAGPKRPQDRIDLSRMKATWHENLSVSVAKRGFGLKPEDEKQTSEIKDGSGHEITHGSVVIAAVTSCTNTSNPSVMIAAGLLAKKAVEKGLVSKPWVKTSLAPGSRVVTDYLVKSGLDHYLEKLGFFTVGYGCTTCIGNSGPLSKEIHNAIHEKNLVVASVLSGNRNFEGRISPDIKANFLASPPLVLAYAIAGTVDIDLQNDVIAQGSDGKGVRLADIWPDQKEIEEIENMITPEMYKERYQNLEKVSPLWNEITPRKGEVYPWDFKSTYIQNPPFFRNMKPETDPIKEIEGAYALLLLGDSVTTDHISPAGSFAPNTSAGKLLISKGVQVRDFNSYGSRRGNDQIMVRGTFANVRLQNQLVPWIEGGYTLHVPSGVQMRIYDVALKYFSEETPLIVLAGKEYGTGSSRDWAAKGTFLLGVKAVIATSFERIHRSNLVGMGVLPLQFKDGKSPADYGLTGSETFSILGLDDNIVPSLELTLMANDQEIPIISRLDTAVEIEYYKNGGILHTVLRKFIKAN